MLQAFALSRCRPGVKGLRFIPWRHHSGGAAILGYCRLRGLRKKKSCANQLSDFRWLAKLSALFRWYCRCWKKRLKASNERGPVNMIGLMKGCSPDDVVALVKEAIRKKVAEGRSMVIWAGDISTAFDAMRHGHVNSTLGPGVDIDTRIALLKQLYNKRAFLYSRRW